MLILPPRVSRAIVAAISIIAIFLLVACTPPPVLRPTVAGIELDPATAAVAPERYRDTEVIWGGEVLDTRNLEGRSEVVILAFPLDDGQRPLVDHATLGRFIVSVAGTVESYDYPQGRFVTVLGRLDDVRRELIGERTYVYPLLRGETLHLWPADFRNSGMQLHFGIGISGGIR